MDCLEYALAADFTKGSPDLFVIIERLVVHQLVEPLLLVVPLDLGEDDLDRVVLGRVGRVEDGDEAKFLVGFHDFRCLVDRKVVNEEVHPILTQFFSEFSKPAHVLLGVDSFLSHLQVLYLAFG